MDAPVSSPDNFPNGTAKVKVSHSPSPGGGCDKVSSAGQDAAAARQLGVLPAIAEGCWLPVANELFADVFPDLRGASLKLLLQLVVDGYEYVPAGGSAGSSGGERYERGLGRQWHLARDVRRATGLSRSGLLAAGEELEAKGLTERTRSAGGRGYAYRLSPERMAPPGQGRGWTKLPEALAGRLMEVSRTALLVTLAVLRQTVGWEKPSDVLATSQLAELTGLAPRSVRRGVQRALRAGLIQRHRSGTSHRYRLAPAALLSMETGRPDSGSKPTPEAPSAETSAPDRPQMSSSKALDRPEMSPPWGPDRPQMSPTKDSQEKLESNIPTRGRAARTREDPGTADSPVGDQNQSVQKRLSNQGPSQGKATAGESNDAKAARALLSAGIDAQTAPHLAYRYPFERILEVVTHAQRREDLRNVPGWIRAALEGSYDLHADGKNRRGQGRSGASPSRGKRGGRSPSHGQMYLRHQVERFQRRGHAGWCFQPSVYNSKGEQLYRYRDPRQCFPAGALVRTEKGNLGTVVEHLDGGCIKVRSREGAGTHAFAPRKLKRCDT